MDAEDDEDDAAANRFYAAPQQTGWGSRSVDAIEIALQLFLRYLGAFVDFLDRLVSAFEGAQAQGFIGLLKWLGSGIRNQLPGLTLLPQDRITSSLWLSSIVILLACFVLGGFRTRFRLFRILDVADQQSVRTPSKRLQLPDGRNIAYREAGVSSDKAKHSALVVQGFAATKSSGIPGVNETLLEQFSIRLVAYDLAGFGQSDSHPNKTFNSSAMDMANVADALGLGEKFWLLVQPGGGPYAWAAIRYIPKRLSGVVLLGPVGDPYKEDAIVEEAAAAASKEWSLGWRLLMVVARRFPSLVRFFVDRNQLNEKITRINKGFYASVADKEQIFFEQREFMAFWEKNLRDTVPKETPAAPFVELLRLINGGWSFRWSFGLGRLKILPKLGFSVRFPSIGSLWRSSSDRQEGLGGSDTLQMIKFKLFLVGIVLLLVLVVLR